MENLLVFIFAVLVVYGGVNLYLYIKVMKGAALRGGKRRFLKYIFILLALCYPLSRAVGFDAFLGESTGWLGAYWLGAMVYGFLFGLFFDLIRLIDIITGWFPRWITNDLRQSGRMALALSVLTILMMLTGGHIRTLFPVEKEIEIELKEFPPDLEEYHLVLFSDAHLGIFVGEKRLKMIVGMINFIEPDVCLIAGDLYDEHPGDRNWTVEYLKQIEAKDGVYAVTGNHDFYIGIKQAVNLMKDAGIVVLRDSVVQLDDAINLIGIDDIASVSQYNLNPKPLSNLVDRAKPGLPNILLSHEPLRKAEALAAGVDLMLCGHTHGGQMFPIGWFTKIIYQTKQGLSKFGKMFIYLSNGVGTAGPPVRIGAEPEIVHIVLKAESEEKQ